MKRTWTIIGVSDVPGSFKWYQSLFGQAETPPGHDDFGQILDTVGTVLLCLHQWGPHEHPSLMSPDEPSPGNGLLLFFRVDDFDVALKRARALVGQFSSRCRLAVSAARDHCRCICSAEASGEQIAGHRVRSHWADSDRTFRTCSVCHALHLTKRCSQSLAALRQG